MSVLRCSAHIDTILNFSYQNSTIKEILATIKRKNLKPDVLVCTGISGIVPTVLVGAKLKKKICIIRKKKSEYSEYDIEGYIPEENDKYLIIDDQIYTGNTLKRILEKLEKEHLSNKNCIGIILYTGTNMSDGYLSKEFGIKQYIT